MNIFRSKTNKVDEQSRKRPVPKGSLAHQLSSDPFLDWVMILVLALILAAALVAGGVSVYLGTGATLGANESVPVKPPVVFDEAALVRALTSFEDMTKRRERIRANYDAPSDPSLP